MGVNAQLTGKEKYRAIKRDVCGNQDGGELNMVIKTETETTSLAKKIKRQLDYKLREFGGGVTIGVECLDNEHYIMDITDRELLKKLPGDKVNNILLVSSSIHVKNGILTLTKPISYKKASPYVATKEIWESAYDNEISSCIIRDVHVHNTNAPSTHLHMLCSKDDIPEVVNQITKGIKLNRRISGADTSTEVK